MARILIAAGWRGGRNRGKPRAPLDRHMTLGEMRLAAPGSPPDTQLTAAASTTGPQAPNGYR